MKKIKKSLLSLLVCMILVSLMFPAEAGAAEKKYYIRSVSDLKKISKNLNGKFYLKKNLDLKNQEWTPIGTADNPFTGEFNGNGYTIKNLKVTKTDNYAGLFGHAVGAKIRRVCVTGKVENVKEYGGGILGLAGEKTVLSYCVSKVDVSGADQIGGVVGRISGGEAKYCINYKAVTATGRAGGGITADLYPSGTVSNCLSIGDVNGGNDLTGGITGGSTAGTISGCVVIGNVTSAGGRIGVIAGDNASYAGARRANYFLKTETVNSVFESIVDSREAIDSADDAQVTRIKDAVAKKIK